MKETFIIRTEWFEAIAELEDPDQAIILRNLFNFHNGNDNLINLNNLNVKLVWKLIEPNLLRNIDSYDRRRETSADNGKKGGRPPKEENKPNNNLNKPIETQQETKEPIESLSVSVTVPVSAIVPVSVIGTEKDIIVDKSTFKPFPKSKEEKIKEREQREYEFYNTLVSYVAAYPPEMVREFFNYWKEPNKSGSKMKYEMEVTWDINLRLLRWQKNNDTWNKSGTTQNETNTIIGPIPKEL